MYVGDVAKTFPYSSQWYTVASAQVNELQMGAFFKLPVSKLSLKEEMILFSNVMHAMQG